MPPDQRHGRRNADVGVRLEQGQQAGDDCWRRSVGIALYRLTSAFVAAKLTSKFVSSSKGSRSATTVGVAVWGLLFTA